MDDDLSTYFAPFIVRQCAPLAILNKKTPLRILVLQRNILKFTNVQVGKMKVQNRQSFFLPI